MAESLAGGTHDIASATVTSLTQIHMPIIRNSDLLRLLPKAGDRRAIELQESIQAD
jgi:hypothetical protein